MPPVFRWDITRPEQLGRLVRIDDPVVPAHLVDLTPQFDVLVDAVRSCCARVIAAAGNSRLVFIGRSPESLYDYLRGATAGTSWADRIAMLNVSFRRCDGNWSALEPAARESIAEQFRSVGVDPLGIVAARRPVALIDLVCNGDTFDSLTAFLETWAEVEGVDGRAMWRRLRVVGITRCYPPDLRATPWRRLAWTARFRPSALAGISIADWFWTYLGDNQPKVSRSNPSWCWADPTMANPPREPARGAALREASALYQRAQMRAERDALIAELASLPCVRHAWYRTLLGELRAITRPKRVERAFGSKWRVRSSNHRTMRR